MNTITTTSIAIQRKGTVGKPSPEEYNLLTIAIIANSIVTSKAKYANNATAHLAPRPASIIATPRVLCIDKKICSSNPRKMPSTEHKPTKASRLAGIFCTDCTPTTKYYAPSHCGYKL